MTQKINCIGEILEYSPNNRENDTDLFAGQILKRTHKILDSKIYDYKNAFITHAESQGNMNPDQPLEENDSSYEINPKNLDLRLFIPLDTNDGNLANVIAHLLTSKSDRDSKKFDYKRILMNHNNQYYFRLKIVKEYQAIITEPTHTSGITARFKLHKIVDKYIGLIDSIKRKIREHNNDEKRKNEKVA